jgi:hypothetical protein
VDVHWDQKVASIFRINLRFSIKHLSILSVLCISTLCDGGPSGRNRSMVFEYGV